MTDSNTSLGDLDVIVVTWNAGRHLGKALAHLPGGVRVVVVDNASADDSVRVAEAAGATVLALDRNVGFPAAVNLALRKCRGTYILLLNPDVRLEPLTIDRCLKALEDPTVGLVGANLVREDGRPDPPAARRFRRLHHLLVETLGLPAISPRLDVQYLSGAERAKDRDVDAVNGAFMLLRRHLFDELGGLDESVFLFLEDQELCRRVWHAGLRVRFVSDAHAIHVGGAATSRADPDQKANIYLHRMDASIELIHRLQGPAARRAAIALWMLRCTIGLIVRGLRSNDERARYLGGLGWLMRQTHVRVPPPPVP